MAAAEHPNDPNAAERGRRHYSRGRHRSASHDSAHAAAAAAGPIPDHPLVPQAPAQLITESSALTDLIDHVRAVGSFAYDSEFIGELTYIPKLCLIQVASSQRIALIDPLAGLDLAPFWELLTDPAVEKIVHAGQQDVEPVIRHTAREPRRLFDTQLAAGFVGMAYPISLSRLVKEVIGIHLGKGLTFTHWDQRPLSAVQLRYAADDVRYLPAIHADLVQRLEALGHTAWAREECEAMCDARQYGFNPDVQYLRVRGAHSLGPQNLAVLRELTIWRDEAARAHDLPPRAFLRDEILADLARSPVKTVEKLARVRGLPKPVEREYGTRIVQATLKALATPPEHMPQPRHSEETPTDRFRADALWAVAQSVCAGRAVDPALVTNRHEIGEWYRTLAEGGDVSELRPMRGWRGEALGKTLLDLIRENARLEMDWHEGLHAHTLPK